VPATLITADGLQLARVAWPARDSPETPAALRPTESAGRSGAAQRRPAVPTPRGTVLIVHGLGEHCERYVRLAADLSAADWLVHSYDQRGHGASEGARGAIATPTSLQDDLALMLEALHDEHVPRPLVLLGHSMGGVVAARFVADGSSHDVDALVLSSPALDPGFSAMQRLRLALGSRLLPNLAVSNGLSPQWISRDPQVVRAYIDDMRVHNRVTPRLARFIFDAGRHVMAQAASWRMPTLLLWAGADRCVSPRGSAAFAAAAPKSVVHARCFNGLAHEIFNEPERDFVVGALIDWLRKLSVPAR
jgi:alpha-beta hydrolase superfamily lysophospholipase